MRLPFNYNFTTDYTLGRFHGYKIFAVDGTTIALPNIPAPKEEFGILGVNNSSPTARVSIAYDVINDLIVDDSLFIYDRGYASLKLIKRILELQGYLLMRVRRKFSLAVDNAPMGDSHVMLDETISVRVIKFKLSSGEVETLITNIEESIFPAFCFLRWPVEIKHDIVNSNFSKTLRNKLFKWGINSYYSQLPAVRRFCKVFCMKLRFDYLQIIFLLQKLFFLFIAKEFLLETTFIFFY